MTSNVKGFRAVPIPSKGKVLAENAQLQGELDKARNAQAQINFIGQIAQSTMMAVKQLAPEVDALTTLESAEVVAEAIQVGDHVMMDYLGVLLKEDGSPDLDEDGLPNYQQEMTGLKFCLRGLGRGGLIAGFEEALVGKKAGDELEITLNFPTEYGVKDLAGKPVKFLVHVHRVYRPLVVSKVEQTIRDYANAKNAKIQAKAAAQAAEEAAKAQTEAPTELSVVSDEAPKAE